MEHALNFKERHTQHHIKTSMKIISDECNTMYLEFEFEYSGVLNSLFETYPSKQKMQGFTSEVRMRAMGDRRKVTAANRKVTLRSLQKRVCAQWLLISCTTLLLHRNLSRTRLNWRWRVGRACSEGSRRRNLG